jgi:predicted  nucleic acid-binding Zn-ribbon protein
MKIIEQLFALQDLELGSDAGGAASRKAAEALRREIPEPILGHFDRLLARGKKGVALVRRGVCTGCQMRLASGVHARLLRDEDICVCDNCARYLLAAPEESPAVPALPAARRTSARRRTPTAVLEPVNS